MFRQSSQDDSWQRGLWSDWVSIMETPTHTTWQDREHLTSMERNTLLHSEHAENKSNPEINIRERMLSMQCKSTDMAQTLFIRDSEVKEMYQVVSVLSVWRICSRWVGCAVTVRRWS